jgi:hypothetical protein
MATQVQWRGGSTAEHATFTGAAREVTVDTQKQTLVVHDGSTAGGEALLREDQANLPGSVTNGIYTPGTNQVAVATNGTGRLFVDASGRIGIGTSSPGVPLDITTVNATANLRITDSTNGAKIKLVAASTEFDLFNTGGAGWLGTATNSPLLLATNGTEKLRITSAGLVGIGTSSPEADLHINDAVGLARLRFTGGAVGADNFEIGQAIVGVSNSGFSIYDVDEAATRFVIDSSGRVGIGTTGPNKTLEVAAPNVIGNYAAIRINSPYYTTWDIANNSDLVFTRNVTEAFRCDAYGRLLVGTSTSASVANPQYARLQVVGNTAGATEFGMLALLRSEAATSITTGEILGGVIFGDSSGNEFGRIFCEADGTAGASDYPGRLVFSTTADGASSPTERMRISSDGHTYWGVANPGTTAFGTAIGRLGSLGFFQTARNVDGTGEVAFFHGNAGEVRIFGDGDLENTNNSYGGLSDLKLKENIVDASSQWSDLKALQVRKYNFKAETGYSVHTQIGLVAQEVELVSPGLVGETIDEETGESTKSVNYSVLYMKAVKALQEAMERIETLEGMVAVNNITIDEQQHQLSTLAARLTALESA